ncbi:type II toxin-antitoxin system RelE/ParE family toxin [Chlorobium sp. KB01]|uniref:type II toxin-antitoxin system RelE/ParE family toxin n=1 Tax=Chlorobium sp. KB01 TaxID=1917528 RepID=UPI00097549DC|nr:type II toxin-antitoxin system RelE/ParE family toxin [Chlorobium sp. KB01]
MRIFKNRWFAKFAKDEGISDGRLCKAVKDAENGLIDADYGGGVIKQRIARLHEGKSGGFRTIIFYRHGEKAFFVYGFPKNEQENISKADVKEYKELAKITFALSDDKLNKLIQTGALKAVKCYE